MSHEVDIDGGADTDILNLTLTIVCDDPPLASVDEGEHWGARSSVGAHRDVHVGHIGIKGRDDSASLEVDPGAIDFGRQPGLLGLEDIQGITTWIDCPSLARDSEA